MPSIKPLFPRNKFETRAASTDAVFRAIIEADSAARRMKTESLKSARVAKEASKKLNAPTLSGGQPTRKKLR